MAVLLLIEAHMLVQRTRITRRHAREVFAADTSEFRRLCQRTARERKQESRMGSYQS